METRRANPPRSGKPAPLPAAPDMAPHAAPLPYTAADDDDLPDENPVVGPPLLRGFLGSGN